MSNVAPSMSTPQQVLALHGASKRYGRRTALQNVTLQTLAVKYGKSILLSTHILHDGRSVCEQVVIMAAGQGRCAVDRSSHNQ